MSPIQPGHVNRAVYGRSSVLEEHGPLLRGVKAVEVHEWHAISIGSSTSYGAGCDVEVVQMHKTHPADDDGLWWFRLPNISKNIRLNPTFGICPFMVENDDMKSSTEAWFAITASKRLLTPSLSILRVYEHEVTRLHDFRGHPFMLRRRIRHVITIQRDSPQQASGASVSSVGAPIVAQLHLSRAKYANLFRKLGDGMGDDGPQSQASPANFQNAARCRLAQSIERGGPL